MAIKKILVTGGAGYIGSHTVLELLTDGYDVVVIDNLDNSSEESIKRIEKITNKSLSFYIEDLRNKAQLLKILKSEGRIDAVIHFAGLKAVGESTEQPLLYYDNNITGTLVLLEAMQELEITELIFSSSATVYGNPSKPACIESMPMNPTNPYGRTKAMIEQILIDLSKTNKDWRITCLRYFNPVGAHRSGLIGEDPNGIPNNLLPFIAQVAVGKRKMLYVFGNNYGTPDGTGVRDYIHVVDLAKGHLAALKSPSQPNEYRAINLGSGKGSSVLEVVRAFEKASGQKVPYQIVSRRPGDIAICYANPSKAKELLGWTTELTLEDACTDSWRWQSSNPDGY